MLAHALHAVAGLAEGALGRLAPGSDAAAQAGALARTGHRPWPLPDGPWVQGQTWCDLLFAHWPVSPEALRPAVPAELPIDTFGGAAWLAVTPFEVRGARPRGAFPVPGLSRFAETNVRTYTTVGGRTGIYFLSLDAASRPAVAGARRAYRLPYFHAAMSIARVGGGVAYRSSRPSPAARLRVSYRPTGAPFTARPGTLEHFLTERYCLYTLDDDHRVHRAEIHHPPWLLQEATAELAVNTMTAPYDIELPGDPLTHFAARQDVVLWPLRPI